MTRLNGVPLMLRLALWALALFIPVVLMAAEGRRSGARAKKPEKDVAAEVVEFFPAMDKGQIQTRLVPKDGTYLCQLIVRNRTEQPLKVLMPDAFGGAPFLAQRVSEELIGNPAPTQAMGMSPPAAMYTTDTTVAAFNLPPEATSQVMLPWICLERHKAGPSARIPYQVKPLAKITDKPEVFELCHMLANRSVNMRMLQAAIWHVNNNLGWNQLLHPGAMGAVPDPLRFTKMELLGAQDLLAIAREAAKRRSEQSPRTAPPQ